MPWLLSILAALLTGITSLFLTGFIANACTSWYHVSNREVASGYFVIFLTLGSGIAGIVIALITARIVAANYGSGFPKEFGAALGVVLLPPSDPDMDAIRKAHNPNPDSLTRLAQRPTGSSVEIATDEPSLKEAPEPEPRRSLTATASATGVKRALSFQDKRSPHEVQFALERELMTLFAGAIDNGKLCMLARGNVNGARYSFELTFEAALFFKNCYSLRVEASWAEQPANSHDYFRSTSDGWFSLWTRDLMAANPPDADAGSPERYRKLAEAALAAEAHLDSITAIQKAIVVGLKRGGSFSTSHKEGGTNIYWRSGKFIRSDYGDYPAPQEFSDDAEFLKMLQQFCHWEVHRLAGQNKLSEFDVWKLILRRLQPK